MGAIWDQEAFKPAPGALQDPRSNAKEPSRAAKRPPRAPRDPPGIDFDRPGGPSGGRFWPPLGPRTPKRIAARQWSQKLQLQPPLLQVTAIAAAVALQNCNDDKIKSKSNNSNDDFVIQLHCYLQVSAYTRERERERGLCTLDEYSYIYIYICTYVCCLCGGWGNFIHGRLLTAGRGCKILVLSVRRVNPMIWVIKKHCF